MIRIELYYRQIYDFLRTLTIKNNWMAERMATEYNLSRGRTPDTQVGLLNPYYRRLAGIYLESDTPMVLTTWDGQQIYQLPVTIERVQTSVRLQSSLRYPKSTYRATADRYSDQSDLLKCIVYPVSVTEAEVDETDAAIVDGRYDGIDIHEFEDKVQFNASYKTVSDAADGSNNLEFKTQDSDGFLKVGMSVDDTVTGIQPGTLIDSYTVSEDGVYTVTLNRALTSDIPSGTVITIGISPNLSLSRRQLAGRITRVKKIADARHMELLAYDASLLEEWEQNDIVQSIYQFLAYFRTRWSVQEFTEEFYYGSAVWSILWYYLIQLILLRRIRNIHTSRVHSRHIWEFLESHGLGAYEAVLDREQSMFLYNNLRYLLANRGKRSNIKHMSEHLLEPKGMEAFTKLMLMNTSSLRNTDRTDSCRKIPQFIPVSVGGDESPSQYFNINYQTLTEILHREHTSGLEPLDSRPSIWYAQNNILENAGQTKYYTPLVELRRPPRYGRFEQAYLAFFMGSLLYEWAAGRMDSLNDNVVNLSYHLSVEILHDLSLGSTSISIPDAVYLIYFIGRKLAGEDDVDSKPLPTVFRVPRALRTQNDAAGTPVGDDTSSSPVAAERLSSDNVSDTALWFTADGGFDMRLSRFLTLSEDKSSDLFPLLPDDYEMESEVDGDGNITGMWFTSMYQFKNEIDRRFGYFMELVRQARTQSGMLFYRAVSAFQDDVTWTGTINIPVPDGITTINTDADGNFEPTYWDWRQTVPYVDELLKVHEEAESDESASPEVTWENFGKEVLTGTIPLLNSKWVRSSTFSDYEYRMMLDLISSLSSYNISFLEQQEDAEVHWQGLPYIGLFPDIQQHGVTTHLPMETLTETGGRGYGQTIHIAAVDASAVRPAWVTKYDGDVESTVEYNRDYLFRSDIEDSEPSEQIDNYYQ